MSTVDDRTRPAVWGPVLLAAVFLAVIGGSVGWVLGSRAEGGTNQTVQEPWRQSPQSVEDNQPAVSGGDTGGGNQGGDQGGGDDATNRPSGKSCPRHTSRLAADEGAVGNLGLELYLRTATSEVWICADDHQRLFYQGHRGQPGEELVEGTNALFLTDVASDGDGYVAVNSNGARTTRYRVTRHQLLIEKPDGTTDTEPATS